MLLVDPGHAEISLRRQCELLGVSRASWYYQSVGESEENLRLMRLLDEQYTRTPFYGSRRMRAWLQTQGWEVNRKRLSRLMPLMGIEAVYPKPNLSQPAPRASAGSIPRGSSRLFRSPRAPILGNIPA